MNHYEMQNMRTGVLGEMLDGPRTSHWTWGHLNHRHFWRTSRSVALLVDGGSERVCNELLPLLLPRLPLVLGVGQH